jgi:hypothetical protein
VRGGNDAASTEFELGAGGLLGLLAAPGAFSCLLLLDKYSTFLNWMRGHLRDDLYVTSLPDKYLFLSLAMGVTGIITVLKWDRILPDSQDYLNLAPLPVRPRSILLANAAAIGIAVAILALDVNGISAIFFPLFVTAAQQTSAVALVRFVEVNAVCMLLASFFTFCAVFALLGTAAAVLPREAFRTASSWLRGGLLVAFIVLLISGFTGPALMIRLAGSQGLRFLPSFWYLGLYQNLQHRYAAALAEPARMALPAVGAAFLLMVVSYGASYRRRFANVLEGGPRPNQHRLLAAILAFLDLFSPRNMGFSKACQRFVVRAMLRNESHRLCIAVAAGLGWLLALEGITEGGESATLQAPLIVAYLLILGLRLAFEIPAGVPANWIFRAVLDPKQNESLGVARRVILSFLAPIVLVPTLALFWWHWGVGAALLETAFVLAVSLCLMEILLHGYRKIPLTCPVPGFRDDLPLACLVQFLGFEIFTRFGAGLSRVILDEPLLFLLVPAVMASAWFWRRVRLKEALEAGEVELGLTFENFHAPVVERLNLFD